MVKAAETALEPQWLELRILLSFRGPDVVVLHVRGELDFHSAPTLAGHVGACRAVRWLVLDCSGVTFADLAGLRAIDTAARGAREAGHDLVLVDSAALRRVADLAGGAQRTSRADSVAAAVGQTGFSAVR